MENVFFKSGLKIARTPFLWSPPHTTLIPAILEALFFFAQVLNRCRDFRKGAKSVSQFISA